jgi:hypothetical protein
VTFSVAGAKKSLTEAPYLSLNFVFFTQAAQNFGFSVFLETNL